MLARGAGGDRRGKKQVVLVKGGPGTGKSVIAINLMGRLLKEGLNAHYATGSRAFTETLRKIIGHRGSAQFKYFNCYAGAEAEVIDVLICDEAHRIRRNSSSMYTPKAQRTDKPQIDELLHAARVSVFFIDDDQVVRPDEIGSAALIRTARPGGRPRSASTNWRRSSAARVRRVRELGQQHAGRPADRQRIWTGAERFDFRIFGSPEETGAAIRARARRAFGADDGGVLLAVVEAPRPDGTLVETTSRSASYRRPWNARPEAARLAAGIPKATLWAHDPGGLDQVGCIYTAQGFEFDYVGVISGEDLIYDFDQGAWKGRRDRSPRHDGEAHADRFVDLVKNTYRVLLTRGLKGCYVCFLDKETERFVRSRIQKQ